MPISTGSPPGCVLSAPQRDGFVHCRLWRAGGDLIVVQEATGQAGNPVDRPAREARGSVTFTQPVRQIMLMLTVVALAGAGAWLILPAVRPVVLANPVLNGIISFVFVLGVLTCFWQVFQIVISVSWVEDFVAARPGHEFSQPPRLLAPLATLLGNRNRGARMAISDSSGRSILDSVATRIDESRDITRYLGNLLIFLGLLGTFFGLATTVPAMVEAIRGLAPQEGETGAQVFDKLMGGLEAQLGGMGTAFSTSLLGLAGALVVGLLDLFAGHGQNRFYRELEEWLSTITRLSFAGGGEAGSSEAGAIIAGMDALLERIEADAQRDAAERAELAQGLAVLAGAIERLSGQAETAERTRTGQSVLLAQIAEAQDRILQAFTGDEPGPHGDAEARMRLRSIDVQLLRILEELSAGRQEAVAELRTDLAALTQAIRALTRGARTGS
jgi:hypothetical protein